jgi:hypothetical protein
MTLAGCRWARTTEASVSGYDWNMLPIGQQLWLKWFETLKAYPPLQAPESYNLTQVMEQIKSGGKAPSG